MRSTDTTSLRQAAAHWLDAGRPALLVTIDAVRGSTPREAGARMLVSHSEVLGTIGGGHLEWRAVATARQALVAGRPPQDDEQGWTETLALGPTLGQCCGGVAVLRFEPLSAASLARWPCTPPRFMLDLHGAGHVGQAIVRLLADLDCQVRWIDQRLDDGTAPCPGDRAFVGLPRDDELAALPPHIRCLPTDDAAQEVAEARDGSAHLILTHRHDLDLAIVQAVLQREDVRQGRAWVGLIGSRTKRAAFEHRLLDRGIAQSLIDRVACPVGLPGIDGKEPAVIAISVVGQLLMQHPAHP